jgi:hypothetical protein
MRNPSGLGITHESLRVAKADVLSQDQLEEALDGSTAAVVAIGRDLQSDQDTLTESAIVITKALQSKGIKRLIMIGGTGIISIGDGKHVLDTPHYPVIYQKVGRDLLGAYKVYAVSHYQPLIRLVNSNSLLPALPKSRTFHSLGSMLSRPISWLSPTSLSSATAKLLISYSRS